MNDYTINDIFDPVSLNYNGALSFNTPPPRAQNVFIDGISPAMLSAGELQGNTTVSDGFLQSSNYVAATTGWRLTPTSGEINFSLSVQQIILGTSGYIRGGQTDYNTGTGFFLGYSGAAYKFSIGDATTNYLTWDGTTLDITANRLVRFFTAGVAITAGEAVSVSNGSDFVLTSGGDNTSSDTITNIVWMSQKFTTASDTISIKKVTIYLTDPIPSSTVGLTVSIRADSGDLPTGSDIEGKTATGSFVIDGSSVSCQVTFTSPVSVSASTVYHIVCRLDADYGDLIKRANTTGQGCGRSTNSGSSWSANNGPLNFAVTHINTVAGRVYKSDASSNDFYANNFVGFAKANISAAASGSIVVAGVVAGLSLSVGSFYYLSDTSGAIASSAGTVSRKVGFAVSTTELVITNIW